jgi:protein-disulfide isomerase
MRANPMTLSRRTAIALAASAALLAGCSQDGAASAPAEGDMALGAAEGAKVTVVEYASVTCHVCAAWQDANWAGFKTRYVDTNKVRYVFREIPTPPVNVAVAGFLLARCAGEDRYFEVVHALMSSQSEWQSGANPRDTLYRIGNGAGLSNDRIQACIADPEGIAAVEARTRAARGAGVTGTPTFFVNDRQIVSPGSQSGPTLADISAAIEEELAKG